MSVRIVVTGSECTGKSTLAAALAEHFGVPFVPEYLREYFVRKNGILTIEDAIPIAKGQLTSEHRLEDEGINPLICDTNLVSSVVYSRHYYGRCPQWIEERLAEREYHHYFLCGLDVPWQPDGQRDRPAEREGMQQLFRDELLRRGVEFTELSGSVAERLALAVPVVERLIS